MNSDFEAAHCLPVWAARAGVHAIAAPQNPDAYAFRRRRSNPRPRSAVPKRAMEAGSGTELPTPSTTDTLSRPFELSEPGSPLRNLITVEETEEKGDRRYSRAQADL